MRLPELTMRISDMSGDDFCELVDDLQFHEWLEEERVIQEAADRYVEHWRAAQNSPSVLARQMTLAHARRCSFHEDASVPTSYSNYMNIVVDIPPFVPIEYVRPFAEQMIREQINPEED